LRRPLGQRCTSAERFLQVDGNAVLAEQIGEGFIRQFLDRRHAVAAKLLQLVESVVVEGDQFAQRLPPGSLSSRLVTGGRAAGQIKIA